MEVSVPFYFIFTFSFALIECLNDQDDGQYHPDNEGRYIPDDSGKYIPDYSGVYHDDGTGRYVGDDNKYRHQRDKQYPYNTANSFNLFNDIKPKINIASASSSKNQYVKPTVSVVTEEPAKYGKYDDNRWKIIKLASDVNKDGFHWEYQTENEISGEENAKIHNSGTKDERISTKGYYQYTGTDNKIYNVEYTADENGFIPRGNHLHPILQRAILENVNRKDD